jgi:predicted thioesterase
MEIIMESDKMIQKGMTREEMFRVAEEHTAIHVGSGGSRVLATPWMIAFMERAAHRLLVENLPAGESSVGVLVDVHHLAPTPIGAAVRVQVEIVTLDGAQVTFFVQAWDQVEKIGEGRHKRVIINEARFLRRVEGKK